MPKRTKEEISAEKEKEKLRALRRGPDLDRFLEGKKRTFVCQCRFYFVCFRRSKNVVF